MNQILRSASKVEPQVSIVQDMEETRLSTLNKNRITD